MTAKTLTPAQQRALAKLTAEPQCAYRLKERLSTLDALVRAGCAKKINPGGAGAIFSPTTFWEYRLP